MKKFILLLTAICLSFMLVSCVNTKISDNIPEKPDATDTQTENEADVPETDVVPEPQKVTLTLYFPDNDALYLHPELREVDVEDEQLLANIVLEELFKGPTYENLSPALDGEDMILSVKVEDGLCTVDFTEDFKLLNSGGTTRETFAIGSIVNSLCELDGIEQVKINIGGNERSEFGGHFTLDAPFLPQTDLVAE